MCIRDRLYHSRQLKVPTVPQTERQAVSVSLPQVPDNEALESFMAIIDGPVLVGKIALPPGVAGSGPPAYQRKNFGQTVFSR